MATETILDQRRADQRGQTLENPFWLTSAEITKDADDLGAVLFSFPKVGHDYVVKDIIVEIVEAFAGGTITLDIGSGTLATDLITTDGDVTIVDADAYIDTTDITNGTIGLYSGRATTALTDGTLGTASDSLAEITDTYVEATIANALASLAAKVNALINAQRILPRSIIEGATTTVPCIYATLVSDDVITAGRARVHILVAKVP